MTSMCETQKISNLHQYSILHRFCYTIYNEKYFSERQFSCPYLEGTKDALYYKFRRHTIGQNCSATCTSEGYRDTFSSERQKVPRISRDLLGRPPSLERNKRRDLFFVIAWSQIQYSSRARTSPLQHRFKVWCCFHLCMRTVLMIALSMLLVAHAY